MKNLMKLLSTVAAVMLTTSAFAWEEWETPEWAEDFRPVGALRGSINFIDHSQYSNTVEVGPGSSFDTFDPDANTTKLGWGAFLGGEWKMSKHWRGQLGVGYDFVRAHPLEGKFHYLGLEEFHGDYEYNLLHQRVDAEFKLLRKWGGWFPFFTTSIGGAWNKTSDYRETNVAPGMEHRNGLLQGETRGSVTYSVGAGIERALFEDHVRIGVGYLFTDAGQAVMKSHTGDELQEEILFNEIFFQLSVLM